MNKNEVVSYIADIPKFTTKNSLEHTREFLARLGNPEEGRKILHVAGTNGKGSVCAYLQSVLLAKGKRTGMFISPHLVELNERIKINGRDISDEKLIETFAYVKRIVKEMEADGIPHPSYFEFLFGMGMYAFQEAGMEYIILETGLGGRLDATNAIRKPAVTVITSISLDHMEILGDTIEAIAGEKAGIIKPHVPVVCLDGKESTPVIEKQAKKRQAPCIKISKNAYEILKIEAKDIDFSTTSAYDKYTMWRLHNTGIYQVENAMLAVKALEVIFPEETDLTVWQEAIQKVCWPGRMEEIAEGIWLDGAHNVGAVEEFAKSVASFAGKKVVLFSAVQDKNYKKMAECLCKRVKADAYIITKIQDTRGEDVTELANVFRQYTKAEVLAKEDLGQAFQAAVEMKGKDGRLYCLGSLYLVGMIKELIGGVKHVGF